MTENDVHILLEERFAQLPEAIQDAITNADVSAHLRKLADSSQLHLDQWQELETEVMMTLMGIKPITQLEQNIQAHVKVDSATAQKLAQDISTVVFAPVREEMERFLSHPSAKEKEGDPISDMTGEILKTSAPINTPTPAPSPAAPPQPTAIRKDAPVSYKPGETSTARKDVHTDPYRIVPE